MMIAFSLTNRPRLGQAKGGLGLTPTLPSPKFKEHEFGGGINYESAHVGWTSMSIVET